MNMPLFWVVLAVSRIRAVTLMMLAASTSEAMASFYHPTAT
jgi:hypothetical protein